MGKRKIRGGIDPGMEGFITYFDDGELKKLPIPVIGKNKNRQYDHRAISEFFFELIESEDVDIFFGVENPNEDPKWSATTNMKLGKCLGLIEQVLSDFAIPYELIKPKVWQKEMWAGVSVIKKPSSTGKTMVNDTKATSLVAAKRLFPKVDFYITGVGNKSKNANDNFVDATLIAEYCKRKIV